MSKAVRRLDEARQEHEDARAKREHRKPRVVKLAAGRTRRQFA
jgi:hypothetical protein